jgi:hypothetical protein
VGLRPCSTEDPQGLGDAIPKPPTPMWPAIRFRFIGRVDDQRGAPHREVIRLRRLLLNHLGRPRATKSFGPPKGGPFHFGFGRHELGQLSAGLPTSR